MKKMIRPIATTIAVLSLISAPIAGEELKGDSAEVTPAKKATPTTESAAKESPSNETQADLAAYEDAVSLGFGAPFCLGILGSAAVVGGIIAILADASSSHSHS